MSSSSHLIFLFLVFIHLVSSTSRVQLIFPYPRCSNLTSNNAYQSELDTLLSSITANNSTSYGFFHASNSSSHQNSDTPNVVGFCRGDLRAQACQTCLITSASEIRHLCPKDKQAIVYSENCTLRYSNQTLLQQVVTNLEDSFMFYDNNVASDPNSFNQALRDLFASLRTEAATGGSLSKFAASNTISADLDTIYGSVQCTPDLFEEQCRDCLDEIYSRLPQCCLGKKGGILLSPSCNFRYETFRFLNLVEPPLPSPPPHASASWWSDYSPPPPLPPTREDRFRYLIESPSSSPTGPSPGSKNNTAIIVTLLAVAVIILVVLIVISIVFMKMIRKRKPQPIESNKELPVEGNEGLPDEIVDHEICDVERVQFDLATMEAATNNFSKDNKLGQGGFGAVYKGKLPNGEEIAVKRLSMNSQQGDLEFKNEVMLLVKLQHRNLVQLKGYSLEGNEKLLIYEFLENSSLDHFIFDPNKRELLDWNTRYKIIIGIARGLLYLHEDSRLRIIHRDLKASNILLDVEMNPKISDFGLAKLFALDQTHIQTNRIIGTYGYMAPESMYGNVSIKSDVFSFGVLVLEIVSGQKSTPYHEGEFVEDLLNYAWRNWREGTLQNVIDPTLTSGSRAQMERYIHIGLLCVQENATIRPTMSLVVLMLNSDVATLALPSHPTFFMHSNNTSDISSTQGYTSWESDKDQTKNKSDVTNERTTIWENLSPSPNHKNQRNSTSLVDNRYKTSVGNLQSWGETEVVWTI